MPWYHVSLLHVVSGGLVVGALAGGVVYQVLVSNTVECLVQPPPPPSPPRSSFLDGPALDMTHGKRF